MATINFTVEDHNIRADNQIELAQASNNYDSCKFTFDSSWSGFNLYAVMYQDPKNVFKKQLDSSNTCKIPADVLKKSGWIYIGARGEKADKTIATSVLFKIRVSNGAIDGNETGQEILNESQYEYLLGKINKLSDEVQKIEDEGITVDPDLSETSTNAIQNKAVAKAISQLSEENAELKGDLGMLITVTEASANMFDKTKVSADKRIERNGTETSLSGAFITNFIPVEPNTKYTWLSNSGWIGSANAQRVVGYSENKTYIDYYEVSTTESGGAMHIDTSNYSSAVKYIRVNGRMNTIESFMFVKGEVYPSTYIPYYEGQKTISKEIEKNPLYGKKIALNGDSICYGAGSTGGFGKIIAEENGMSISNIAASGGTIAYSSGRHCISRTITNMPSDADYYIIEGGANDWSIDVPIGNVTDTYLDTFDDTTMCGALESICKTLQLNFKGKKYGFIFPHNVGGYKQGWTTTFRPKMKECLKKWGIPYLDLSEECVQLRNRDELRIYTANGDGWHPTEEGYRLFYVPKIEAWLKTL